MTYRVVKSLTDESVINTLKSGGLVVLKTDTLYGILAKANDDQAVERVYQLKHRSKDKSPITLIANINQLYDEPSATELKLIESVWPGPSSVIIRGTRAPWWLKRDNASVAYRLPDSPELNQLIEAVGPVIAPSANPESEPPACSIEEAIDYFGDSIDIYVDSGEVTNPQPSRLYRVDESGEVERLR